MLLTPLPICPRPSSLFCSPLEFSSRLPWYPHEKAKAANSEGRTRLKSFPGTPSTRAAGRQVASQKGRSGRQTGAGVNEFFTLLCLGV